VQFFITYSAFNSMVVGQHQQCSSFLRIAISSIMQQLGNSVRSPSLSIRCHALSCDQGLNPGRHLRNGLVFVWKAGTSTSSTSAVIYRRIVLQWLTRHINLLVQVLDLVVHRHSFVKQFQLHAGAASLYSKNKFDSRKPSR